MSVPTSTDAGGRRAALRRLSSWFLALASWAATGHAAGRMTSVCADPNALGSAERRQRELDNYTERSPDPHATCRACRFFTVAAAPDGCGTCQLFHGPANPRGRCDDWTPADPK